MTFAEILKEMRLELRLSQPACAAHLGVSRRTLQYWEAGEERDRKSTRLNSSHRT